MSLLILYLNIILVLYGCGTWSLTLREEDDDIWTYEVGSYRGLEKTAQ
jgi:hypothetical protein